MSSTVPNQGSTPKDAHIQFSKHETTQETPFVKTMKYFKQFKDKENTPSKSRRNASLPEEIAELAKAAQQEDVEEDKEMWDKFREMDLAPEDPVMGDGLAGDLIIPATPMKKLECTLPANNQGPTEPLKHKEQSTGTAENVKTTVYEILIPGNYDDAFALRFGSRSQSLQQIALYIRLRAEELEANIDDIDFVVNVSIRILHLWSTKQESTYRPKSSMLINIAISRKSVRLHRI